MPDTTKLGFVVWRNVTDPPEENLDRPVLIAVNQENGWNVISRAAWLVRTYIGAYDQWAEYPSPPDCDDALTVEDLRELLLMVDDLAEEAGLHMSLRGSRAYARLRCAIESLKDGN